MCAECHSTGLRKNYDAKTDRFATTWAEISVGCETCHGQGSATLPGRASRKAGGRSASARIPSKGLLVLFDERRGVTWPIDPQTANRATLHRAGHPAQGSRDLRPVPRPPCRIPRELGARPVSVADPCGRSARARHLSRGRPDAGRGRALQLYTVQARKNVCRRRHMQRLPRAAQRETSRFRRGRLPAVPCIRQICRREASPPRQRRSITDLHFLPHADTHLSWCRYSP